VFYRSPYFGDLEFFGWGFQSTWSFLGVKDFPFFYFRYLGIIRLKDVCKVVCQDVCFFANHSSPSHPLQCIVGAYVFAAD